MYLRNISLLFALPFISFHCLQHESSDICILVSDERRISETYFLQMSAYYSDICVGAIACRLEKKEGGVRIYIMTLGVLAPYRGLGIGSKLLKHCLDLGFQDPSIVEIYLHVQTNNEEAISFYQKFGFEIKETIKNYYSNIDPPDCYVLAKSLTSSSKPKSTS
eukprot:TRINITY_DN5519_c0_g1_i2.p1 TRINITY_DN5519_c0_g1~~TRINITY_DN5519_c0_g1_i2.p1  ORF type:complete len:163 (+),score=17.49 TRINITY_DN5519_c0_g1_i2:117-605(+)